MYILVIFRGVFFPYNPQWNATGQTTSIPITTSTSTPVPTTVVMANNLTQTSTTNAMITTMSTAEPTTIPLTEPTTTIATTGPTTISTTQPTTIPTTVPTTIPTTEPTTMPTTESTTIPTTEPTTMPTTEPSTIPTTIASIIPSTIPTTEPTTQPTTESLPAPIEVPPANDNAEEPPAVDPADVDPPAVDPPDVEPPAVEPPADNPPNTVEGPLTDTLLNAVNSIRVNSTEVKTKNLTDILFSKTVTTKLNVIKLTTIATITQTPLSTTTKRINKEVITFKPLQDSQINGKIDYMIDNRVKSTTEVIQTIVVKDMHDDNFKTNQSIFSSNQSHKISNEIPIIFGSQKFNPNNNNSGIFDIA